MKHSSMQARIIRHQDFSSFDFTRDNNSSWLFAFWAWYFVLFWNSSLAQVKERYLDVFEHLAPNFSLTLYYAKA